MLESMPVMLAVGTVLGFLAGLGIGGGSLLILWLTMVLGMEQAVARSINLLFFLPSAAIACLFRWKQGCIPWKQIWPGILLGCIAAGVFSWLSSALDTALLKKLFGGLLILTGLRELFYRPQKSD
ncbi:MAG: TSUP family transporter [Oscillospiraceae bacterium]|nr:TSUP family transporter [Oscillospiraceae bacterium]